MTAKEISNFVNQRTPREIPYGIFRKVTPWGSSIIWNFYLSALIILTLFSFIYFVFEINIVFLYVLGFVFIASSAVIYLKSRRAMRLLKEGFFTTGHIHVKDDSSFKKSRRRLEQRSGKYDQFHVARFTDQSGEKREASIIAPFGSANISWIFRLSINEQSVGLLYLPDANAVIVTDLWLDAYPELSPAEKHEREKAEEAAYQNMSKEEIAAQEKFEAELMADFNKLRIVLVITVGLALSVLVWSIVFLARLMFLAYQAWSLRL